MRDRSPAQSVSESGQTTNSSGSIEPKLINHSEPAIEANSPIDPDVTIDPAEVPDPSASPDPTESSRPAAGVQPSTPARQPQAPPVVVPPAPTPSPVVPPAKTEGEAVPAASTPPTPPAGSVFDRVKDQLFSCPNGHKYTLAEAKELGWICKYDGYLITSTFVAK